MLILNKMRGTLFNQRIYFSVLDNKDLYPLGFDL